MIHESSHVSVGFSSLHVCFYTISILNNTCLRGSASTIVAARRCTSLSRRPKDAGLRGPARPRNHSGPEARTGRAWPARRKQLPPSRQAGGAKAAGGVGGEGGVGAARGHYPSRYPSRFRGKSESLFELFSESLSESTLRMGARAGAVVWPFHCGRFEAPRNRALSLIVVETALFHWLSSCPVSASGCGPRQAPRDVDGARGGIATRKTRPESPVRLRPAGIRVSRVRVSMGCWP